MPKRSSAAASLTLPSHLDIGSVRPLLEELRALRGAPLTLDGSEITRVGGLGLQILLSARATWLADDQPLTIANPSPALEEACTLAGASLLPC